MNIIEELKNNFKVKEINLYITHGIFSKGLLPILGNNLILKKIFI